MSGEDGYGDAGTPLVPSALAGLLQSKGWYDGTRERSQRTLARLTGVGHATIRRMFLPIEPFSDSLSYNDTTLQALAQCTGIPLGDILDAVHVDRTVLLLGEAPKVSAEERAVFTAAATLPAQQRRRLVARLVNLDVEEAP